MEQLMSRSCRRRSFAIPVPTAEQRELMFGLFTAIKATGRDPSAGFDAPFLALAIQRSREIQRGTLEDNGGKWLGMVHEIGAKLGLSPEVIAGFLEVRCT
jgi:hypothetical protein